VPEKEQGHSVNSIHSLQSYKERREALSVRKVVTNIWKIVIMIAWHVLFYEDRNLLDQ
jgi:hypothetical protein